MVNLRTGPARLVYDNSDAIDESATKDQWLLPGDLTAHSVGH